MTCYKHSTIDNPVAEVHRLYKQYAGSMTRVEFIVMCERAGINPNTASTQYNVAKSGRKQKAYRR